MSRPDKFSLMRSQRARREKLEELIRREVQARQIDEMQRKAMDEIERIQRDAFHQLGY
jgi:hypothetical protein